MPHLAYGSLVAHDEGTAHACHCTEPEQRRWKKLATRRSICLLQATFYSILNFQQRGKFFVEVWQGYIQSRNEHRIVVLKNL